ncbi:MAG: hypothetical protein OXN89_23715 [Bryobacterales bacterium]|nr:hypothetical protein [Bryobacterales bacterium]
MVVRVNGAFNGEISRDEPTYITGDTAREILDELREGGIFTAEMTLDAYLQSLARNAGLFAGANISAAGATLDERAQSVFDGLVAAGLFEREEVQ